MTVEETNRQEENASRELNFLFESLISSVSMNNSKSIIVTLTLLMASVNNAFAETITFIVSVDQDTIILGQSVDWQLSVLVGDSTASNFGIETVTANLTDSLGETLNPAVISGLFADYDPFVGNFAAPTLFEVGADSSGGINEASVVGAHGLGLGPFLLATGSYTPTMLGSHTLSATEGSTNYFYTSANLQVGEDEAFTFTPNIADSFIVNAASVPEPSSVVLLMTATVITGAARLRARRKTEK